jgi:AmmeMemoRadiSam system protein A
MADRELTSDELELLGELAAAAIASAVRGVAPVLPEPPPGPLGEPAAAFVTVRHDGVLRGCVGGLEPERALVHEVVVRAVAASSRDPRFAPVRPEELAAVEVEVSVLSSPETLVVSDCAELVEVVRPGVDGLIVALHRRRATLLPTVWEQVPDPGEFLDLLWRKAGLRPGHWPTGLVVQRYVAQRSVARPVLSVA